MVKQHDLQDGLQQGNRKSEKLRKEIEGENFHIF